MKLWTDGQTGRQTDYGSTGRQEGRMLPSASPKVMNGPQPTELWQKQKQMEFLIIFPAFHSVRTLKPIGGRWLVRTPPPNFPKRGKRKIYGQGALLEHT